MVEGVGDKEVASLPERKNIVGVVEVGLAGLALTEATHAAPADRGDLAGRARQRVELPDAVSGRVHEKDVAAAIAGVQAREAGAPRRLVVAGRVELVLQRAAEAGGFAPCVVAVALASELGEEQRGAVVRQRDTPGLRDRGVERLPVQRELLAVARLRGGHQRVRGCRGSA